MDNHTRALHPVSVLPRAHIRFLQLFAVALLAVACVDTGTAKSSRATGGTGATTEGGGANAEVPSYADNLAKDMGMGVNIGNTLDNTAAWETGWGQPRITQDYVKGMASHGIKTVRVPVAWNTYADAGVIGSDKLTRVREVVGYIIDAGMYAIVNIHWDGGWLNNQTNANQYQLTDDVRTKFNAYWTQISGAFSDVGDHLVFEAMNEEGVFYVGGNSGGSPDYAPLNELNQSFVTTVRNGGGENATRALLISGFATDIEKTCVPTFKIPSDPAGDGRLLLSVHYYTPYTFCIMDKPANYWGDQMTYPATTWGTSANQAELKTLFTKLAAFSNSRHIPIIIGEFSVTLGRSPYVRESSSRILWMQSVASTAFENNMVPVLWDTGSDVSRTDGSLSSDFQAVMTELGL